MTEQYRWSPISTEHAEAWAQLTNHLAVVDGTEEFHNAEDRREELNNDDVDPQLDTLAVWQGEAMVGFGTVSVRKNPDREGRARISIDGGVHPDHRRRGIGSDLMRRLEARGRHDAAAKHPGRRHLLRTGGGLSVSSARRFHLSRGYRVARHFHLMSRRLGEGETADELLTRPVPDEGFIRAPQREDEQAVMQAHTAAFADHWGSAPPVPSAWHQQWISRSSRPDVSRIALDPSGNVLAYAMCSQWVEGEIYVSLLGTVPAARGQGLGSAVLAHAMEAAAASGGYQVMELDVDSESLTGATRLYERIGFHIKHTSALMHKEG